MPQSNFGPTNISQGNSARFVLEFRDVNGGITTPPSADLQISYTNTANNTQTDDVPLTIVGSYYTGIWSSTSAILGLANWVVTSLGSTIALQQGIIRVISP
jgi:hypothetical protein